MRRFYIDPNKVKDGIAVMESKEDVHHILNVLRMEPGDEVVLFDGTGREYSAVILSDEKNDNADLVPLKSIPKEPKENLAFSIKSEKETERKDTARITLFQGVPKRGKLDGIVRQTTELGVSEIVPVYTHRSVPKDNGNSFKQDRLNKIATEAARQSGRTTIPDISTAINFEKAVDEFKGFDLVLFLYEDEKDISIRYVLEKSFRDCSEKIRRIAVMIGPEGGFMREEVEAAKAVGAFPCSLGDTILRTETAGPAAIAMLRYATKL